MALIGLALSPGDAAALLTAIEFSEPFLNEAEVERVGRIRAALRAEINDAT
jgi:hypothetical protein